MDSCQVGLNLIGRQNKYRTHSICLCFFLVRRGRYRCKQERSCKQAKGQQFGVQPKGTKTSIEQQYLQGQDEQKKSCYCFRMRREITEGTVLHKEHEPAIKEH